MPVSSIAQQVQSLREDAQKALESANSLEELNVFSTKFIGKKSPIQAIFKELKNFSAEEKKELGPLINTLRDEVQLSFETKKEQMTQAELNEKLKQDWIDVTKEYPTKQGSQHPISRIQKIVEDVFTSMGFMIADGPELETEWNNFDALNIPPTHPARDMQDTFFVSTGEVDTNKNSVLRTHTSNLQIRSLKEHGAPLRVIAPGRVFRNEALDATHDAIFYQVEGVVVDKGISLAHLKGVIEVMLNKIFGKKIKMRIRPGYFPFVEPGLEIDIWWEYKDKKGETQGKWLEFMGAGMMHPNVLKNCGIDSTEYSGFAFGFGLTRLAMMKYGIEDIRLLFDQKKEFLEQF